MDAVQTRFIVNMTWYEILREHGTVLKACLPYQTVSYDGAEAYAVRWIRNAETVPTLVDALADITAVDLREEKVTTLVGAEVRETGEVQLVAFGVPRAVASVSSDGVVFAGRDNKLQPLPDSR